jgi:hypothetical protein
VYVNPGEEYDEVLQAYYERFNDDIDKYVSEQLVIDKGLKPNAKD